jgi:NADH-quinone oxidoreductase subunit M
MDVPLLSMMILVPLVGTVITFLLPKNNTKAKWVCLIAALVNLFISFILVFAFVWEVPFTLVGDPVTGGFKAYENFDWVPTLGMSYTLGVDGLSIPLIVLTQLLVALGIVFSWKEEERTKEFFALLLLMDLSITGVFISLDLFLFFIFWELVLIPMYFLIGIWGGPNKHWCVHIIGPFPVLHLLGAGADTHVLPHRDMGRSEQALCSHQVPYLHTRRQRHHVASQEATPST